MELDELRQIAREIRFEVIRMSHRAKTIHLGSSLSCVDVLVALYFAIANIDPKHPKNAKRDRCILSKGHAASTLYATLAYRGYFEKERLLSFAQAGSAMAEHQGVDCLPGVEAATGSLGHGLSLGLGMLLAGRIKNEHYRAFCLLSDGECNEGTTWEAAMFAAAKQLDNLVAIIDFNKWQATGRSQEIMQLDPLADKWRSFGWTTYEIDGNNMEEILAVLNRVPEWSGKPIAIIAHTVKGKGVSFMEDDNNWHYRIPNSEEVEMARKEIFSL